MAIGSVVGPFALTAVFVLLTGYAALRAICARTGAEVAAQLCHLVMAAVMALMVWPVWTRLPVAPQLAFFGLVSAWFVWCAISPPPPPESGAGQRAPAVLHAVMNVAMVWMIAAMAGGDGSGHHHDDGIAMPVALLGLALTAALIVAAVAHVVGAVSEPTGGSTRRRPWRTADAVAGAAMCIGMVAMTYPMSVG